MKRRLLLVLLLLAGLAAGGWAALLVLFPDESRTVSHSWSIAEISADQRELSIAPAPWGGCDTGPPRVSIAAETTREVVLRVTTTERTKVGGFPVDCPAKAQGVPPVTVRLRRPLAGRRVTGRRRIQGIDTPSGRRDPRVRVPRIVGLHRDDAIDALCRRGILAATTGRGAVVQAQVPPAGARLRLAERTRRTAPPGRCRIALTRTRATLSLDRGR